MQVKEIDRSKRPWPQAPLSWKGGLAVVCGTLLIELTSLYFGKRALALPTIVSIIILASAGSMKWQLRRHVWFWMTMIVFAAIHGTLILSVHWTADWVPAVVIIPIGIADLYVMLTIIDVVGKLVRGRNPLKNERAHSRLR
jgi:hypothetical protein